MRVRLFAVLATTVLGVAALGAGAQAADPPGTPFACTSATDFVASENGGGMTQLYSAADTGAPPTFSTLGSASALYNAMGFDPTDHFLYAIDLAGGHAQDLLKVDDDGNVTDVGAVSGLPNPGAEYATGAFDPAGNLWVLAEGQTTAYKIDVATDSVSATLSLSGAPFTPHDWTYADGYMWGYDSGDLLRVDLSTGVVTPITVTGAGLGLTVAAWTFANGNLGFGIGGAYIRVNLTTHSATTFSGPLSGANSDGTSCQPQLSVSGGGTLADGTYGAAYGGPGLSATGGVGPYTWTATSPLPGGLTLNSDGTVSGTPTDVGTFTFGVQVSDSLGNLATATETITIDPAALTLTVAGSQDYGADASTRAFSVTGASGFVPPDMLSTLSGTLSCTSLIASSAPAGVYGASISCGGLSDPDYAITYADGGFTINAVPLTANVSGTQVYGGVPAFTVDSYSGLTNGDTAGDVSGTPLCATSVTSTTPVGSYSGTLSGCSGLSDPNYTITYNDDGVTVTPAALALTVSGSQTYGADASTRVFAVTASSGFVAPDNLATLSGTLTCASTVAATAPAGSYGGSIGCTGLSDPNYAITYIDGGFTINPAALVANVAGTEVYGSGSASYSVPTYTTLVNGDTPSSISGSAACSTTVVATTPVGSYAGTLSGCGGLSDPNYTITYADHGFTVTPAALTITASSSTMPYGGPVPAITAAGYSGFQNGEGPGVLSTPPACSTTATVTSPVGSYPSSCTGAAAHNYTITYAPGSVTVGPATLTVTVKGSQTYGGAGRSFSVTGTTGFVNGQGPSVIAGTLTGCASSVSVHAAAGAYAGTISGCGGLSAPNYAIAIADGGFTVSPAALTITASSATVPYGGTVPAITASYSGLTNGDTSLPTPPTCSTTAVSTTPGVYPSTCAGAVDANYTISYVPGSVTVTGGPTTLTYTGPQQVSTKSTFAPAATLASTAPSCVPGQQIAFSLNVNPTNGAAGPYALGTGTTGAGGVATAPAVSTAAWQAGSYTITATYAGAGGCQPSMATTALSVTAAGLATSGWGYYTVPGAGPVSFAFFAALIPHTTHYIGQISLVNDHRWQLIGTVSSYVKTSSSSGQISGTGSLYWFNKTLNHGCGGWVLAAVNVPWTGSFTPTTRTSLGTFGIKITYTPTGTQPSPLPTSAPIALLKGLIAMS
jgi:hypothetical protein